MAPERRSGVRALLQPGWLLVISLAIVFAALCFWVLAPWQFHRHDERDAQNNQIVTNGAAAPESVLSVLSTTNEPPIESIWRTVTATGTFRESGQVQVRLRQEDSMAANEVLVPFELTSGEVLLVDRGYISQLQLQAGEVPPALPSGIVTISGRVQQDQPDPSGRPPQVLPDRVEYYGIDPAQIVPGDSNVLKGFIQLTDNSPGVMRAIGVPQVDDGPFLSYAFQWITFGAIALLAIGFFAYREIVERDEDPDAAANASPVTLAPTPSKQKFNKSDLYD